VAGSDFFRSVSQFPRHREVMKILAMDFMHFTKQLCKSELKIKLKNKRERKYKLRKNELAFFYTLCISVSCISMKISVTESQKFTLF
jgi:hypothetical protein